MCEEGVVVVVWLFFEGRDLDAFAFAGDGSKICLGVGK